MSFNPVRVGTISNPKRINGDLEYKPPTIRLAVPPTISELESFQARCHLGGISVVGLREARPFGYYEVREYS